MTSNSVWDKLRIVFALTVVLFVLTASPSFADAKYATVESGNIKVSVPTEVPTYVQADGTVLTGHASLENIGSSEVAVSVSDVASDYSHVSFHVSTEGDSGDVPWFSYGDEGKDVTGGTKTLQPGQSLDTSWDVKKLDRDDNSDLLENAVKNNGAVLATVTFSFAGPQDFAVYSADDATLRFYHRATVPADGEMFDRHRVTKHFVNIGKVRYDGSPFSSVCDSVKRAVFVDKGLKPKSTHQWFYGMDSLESIENLDRLDTSDDIDMYQMFDGCRSLSRLDVSHFDTSNVQNSKDCAGMHGMFEDCSSLTSLDLSGFDTSRVTDFRFMFSGCSTLTDLKISSFDTSQAQMMLGMFEDCSSLKELDLSNFATSNVADMSYMFQGCTALSRLNLSGFSVTGDTGTDSMFDNCGTDSLVIAIGDGWRIDSFPSSSPSTWYDANGHAYDSDRGEIDPAVNKVYYRENPVKAEDAVTVPSSNVATGESPAIDPQAGSCTLDGADTQSAEDESDTRCGEPAVDDAQTTDSSTSP